jgi:hypothetical protein
MPLRSRFAPLAVAVLLLAGGAKATLAAGQCDDGVDAADRTAEITLTAADFFDPDHKEMRTFVETGSLGMVDAAILSSRPRGIVRSLTAVPARSLLSPYFGEDLKGIAVTVMLYQAKGLPVVRLRLRQDCAEYMRNTFLYY